MKMMLFFALLLPLADCSSRQLKERSVSSEISANSVFFPASKTNHYSVDNISEIDLSSLKVFLLDSNALKDTLFSEKSVSYDSREMNLLFEGIPATEVRFKVDISQKHIELTGPLLAKKGQVVKVVYVLKK